MFNFDGIKRFHMQHIDNPIWIITVLLLTAPWVIAGFGLYFYISCVIIQFICNIFC